MEILLRLNFVAFILWILVTLVVLGRAWADDTTKFFLSLFVPFYLYWYAFTRMGGKQRGLIVSMLVLTTFPGPVLSVAGRFFVTHTACSLLDKSEVEQAFGSPADDPVQKQTLTPFGIIDGCKCQTKDEPHKAVVVAQTSACIPFDKLRGEAEAELTKIESLGDEALWSGSEMVVRRNRTCLYFLVEDEAIVNKMLRGQRRDIAVNLAQKALDRLPQ